jgi:predicted transcriptional regulator of viral defense system
MKSAKEKTIALFKNKGGLLRTSEALDHGIHRRTLYGLRDEGILVAVSRGLYQLAEMEVPPEINLAEVAKRVPKGVICLVSALAFHELTTQIPHYVWLAVERKARKPRIEYPPVRVFHFSGKAFTSGIESRRILHQTVRIYNAPKTIIDCFRWRKAVGLDVAIEATREYLKLPDSSPSTLIQYAKVCGMEKRVTPYLEAMTA